MKGRLCPDSGTGSTGPQVDAQPELKAREGGHVGPDVAADDAADARVVDAGEPCGLTDTTGGDLVSHTEGEEADDLSDLLGALCVGPALAEGSGGQPTGAGHRPSIEPDNKVLVSIDGGPRLQPIAGDFNQRRRAGRTTYATPDEKVAGYTPLPHLVSPAIWAVIDAFVRQAVTQSNPPSVVIASRRLSVLSPYVAWCCQTDIPLVNELVFTTRNIQRFIADGRPPTWSEGALATQRSTLMLIGRAVVGEMEDLAGVFPLPKAPTSPPYKPKEMAGFVSWANHQPSAAMSRGARTLLGGARGAGLTRSDFQTVRGSHLSDVGNLLVVDTVGPRPRRIPVLPEWADMLRSVRDEVDPDELLFGANQTAQGRNLTSWLISRSKGVNKPDAQRLRSSWYVEHFIIGTPVDEVKAMAGVTSDTALKRLLPFVPESVAARVRRELREALK